MACLYLGTMFSHERPVRLRQPRELARLERPLGKRLSHSTAPAEPQPGSSNNALASSTDGTTHLDINITGS